MTASKFEILVLDDDPWHVAWIEDFVESIQPDARISFVSTYDEAVRFCERCRPHLVILDIMIGNVDLQVTDRALQGVPEEWVGVKFARYIRVQRAWKKREVQIIVYTGLDRQDLAQLVESTYQAIFCTKADSDFFRSRLRAVCRPKPKRKVSPRT